MMARVATIVAPREMRIVERNYLCPDDGYIARVDCIAPSLGTELALYRGFSTRVEHGWEMRYPMELDTGTTGYGVVIEQGTNCAISPGTLVASRKIATVESIPGSRAVLLPDGIDRANACFLHPARVALDAVRRSGMVIGDTVVVVGLGLIGQLCVQLAVLHGAWRVIVCDRSAHKVDVAIAHGAACGATDLESAAGMVAEVTDGRGAPVVFECVGAEACVDWSMRVAGFRAKIVLVAWHSAPVRLNLSDDFHFKQLHLVASQIRIPHAGNLEHETYWDTAANYRYLCDCLRARKINITGLVSEVIDLEELPSRFNLLIASKEYRDATITFLIDNSAVARENLS